MPSHTFIETPCLVMRWYYPTWILTCPNCLSRMFKTLSGTNTTSPVNGTKSRPYARYNGMMDRKCTECWRSTHFHLVQRSNKSGVIPLLPSHAYKTCKTTAYFHIHRQAAAVNSDRNQPVGVVGDTNAGVSDGEPVSRTGNLSSSHDSPSAGPGCSEFCFPPLKSVQCLSSSFCYRETKCPFPKVSISIRCCSTGDAMQLHHHTRRTSYLSECVFADRVQNSQRCTSHCIPNKGRVTLRSKSTGVNTQGATKMRDVIHTSPRACKVSKIPSFCRVHPAFNYGAEGLTINVLTRHAIMKSSRKILQHTAHYLCTSWNTQKCNNRKWIIHY